MGSITVTNLGKAYKQYPTRWARLAEWIIPGSKSRHQLKWVLQDVSFTVNPGEAVGIIGINGAGKSTLLKMITGTTQPTTGSVQIKGRVAALLELGMGFHPDFTGRQNVLMAGQLQGLGVEEVQALMPEIEAFADIGDYIDQPVRVYSSGMQVRLAFAVATAVRPEILIVDEALSVGDVAFQRKCFQRIESFRAAGTTLLFVSHDTSTIKKLCSRSVYLRNGQLWLYDDAKLVCDLYEKHLFGFTEDEPEVDDVAKSTTKTLGGYLDASLNGIATEQSFGGEHAVIENVSIQTDSGEVINVVRGSKAITLAYSVHCKNNAAKVNFGMMIRTVEGIAIYGTNTNNDGDGWNLAKDDVVKVSFSFYSNLMPGTYFISCGVSYLTPNGWNFLHRRVDCAILRVIESQREREATGLVNLAATHTISVTQL